MTEKEAIKNLKEIIDLSKEEIENNDENTTAILDITDLKSLAIVLKSLEQKDKEIAEERIKYISSNLNNTIKQRQKEDEQLNALNEGWKIELEQKDKEIQELKADLYECNNIISDYIDTVKEKDKIIDLMAKYIADEDTTEMFCIFDEEKICDDEECKECVLQYFQKKASEENE